MIELVHLLHKQRKYQSGVGMKRIVAPSPLNVATVQHDATEMAPTHVDAASAAALIAEQPELIVLDVRTPDEFADGRIKGAINIDFFDDNFEQKLSQLDRSSAYLIHCRSGGRSEYSLPILAQLGFRNIVHLDGGYDDWHHYGQAVSH